MYSIKDESTKGKKLKEIVQKEKEAISLLTFYQNQNLGGHGSPAIILSLYAKLRRAPGHQMTGEGPSDLDSAQGMSLRTSF